MRRASLTVGTIVVLGCLISGCSATRGAKSDASLGQSEAAEKNGDEQVADANPLKPDASKEKSSGENQAKAESDVDAEAESTDKTKNRSHDAATLTLIERELQDATPNERTELFNDLKGLEPQMVRLILSTRRMVRQMGQKNTTSPVTQVAAQGISDWAGSATNVQPAHAAAPPIPTFPGGGYSGGGNTAQHIQSGNTGMGTASPWHGPQPPNSPAHRSTNHVGDQQFSRHAPNNSQQSYSQSPFGNQQLNDRRASNGTTPPAGYPSVRTPNQSVAGRSVPLPGSMQNRPFGANQFVAHSRDSQQAIGVPPSGANPYFSTNRQNPAVVPSYPVNARNRNLIQQPTTTQGANSHPSGLRLPNIGATEMSSQFDASAYHPQSNAIDANWNQELQRLIALAADEAARTSPGSNDGEPRGYVEKQVYLRMLYLMAGQPERAFEPIYGIDPADQEFWLQLMWGIASYFDPAIADPNDRATQTVGQLRTAVEKLQEKAKLELRNVTFCHKIDSFGNYERFPRDEFSPGQPVLVYAEVRNFKSEQAADNQFRTILRSTVDIHKVGPSGDLIESIPFQPTEDLCRNHRRDYFHSYEFTVPQRISLGPHVMKLTIEDQLSRKIATYSLNFTVK